MSVRFRMLDAGDARQRQYWLELFRRWPQREPAAHPSYAELLAGPAEQVFCATLECDEGGVLFPLVLRPLGREEWLSGDPALRQVTDLTSPYGYGGPFQWGSADPVAFWSGLGAWAEEVGAVSLFTRLSLFADQRASFDGVVKPVGRNIVRNLGDPDGVWMDYRAKVRKNVKRARSEGVQIVVDQRGDMLADFIRIYDSTMNRNSAEERLRFSPRFFRAISAALDDMTVFFHAVHDGRVVSTELVLVSRDHLYSFLGGTEAAAFPVRPNDLLKHAIIEWGTRQGKRAYVLGGSYRGNEGLLRYKQSFAPAGDVPFEVGQKVFRPALYDALCDRRLAWKRERGLDATAEVDYFPAYRA